MPNPDTSQALTPEEARRASAIAEDPTIGGGQVYEADEPTLKECQTAIWCWERGARQMRELLGKRAEETET